MRIIITENYEELGKVSSQHLLAQMFANQDRVNIAITGGTTPMEVYRYLIPEVKGKSYLNHVHYYNFDEIPIKDGSREGVTMTDLRRLYLTPASVMERNIHILNEENYAEQDKRIHEDGGLDAILLGIGADGHYCGNLPGTTTINDFTSKIPCDESMKKRIARLFENEKDIPDDYVTMGPRSIMAARQLILIANGEKKAEIMQKFIEEDITDKLPATFLKLHPNLTIILDKEAASKLGQK